MPAPPPNTFTIKIYSMAALKKLATGSKAKEFGVFLLNGKHHPRLRVHVVKNWAHRYEIILYNGLYRAMVVVFDKGTWVMWGKVSLEHSSSEMDKPVVFYSPEPL